MFLQSPNYMQVCNKLYVRSSAAQTFNNTCSALTFLFPYKTGHWQQDDGQH